MREDGRNVGADILDSVPRRPYSREEFNNRLAELHNMPLRQLEQVGQQTLDNMQAAGVPVSEGLANDLTAGKENAIAHAESKMAEAGVNPTVSNQEQVPSDVASQATNEPTSKKEESRIVTKFRDDAVDIVNQYRDDKITYTEAQSKLEDAAVKAANKAKDENTKAAVWDTFAKSATFLEGFRQQKEASAQQEEANEQQKPDYSNISLDEL
jgi:selenocysteine-specific translation elongation factor